MKKICNFRIKINIVTHAWFLVVSPLYLLSLPPIKHFRKDPRIF